MISLVRHGASVLALLVLFGACSNEPGKAAPRDQPTGPSDPVELGKLVHKRMGCMACHSLDGSKLAGPSYLGLFETPVEFEDGASGFRDEAYLRVSILRSEEKMVKGYKPVMQNYEGLLSDAEIDGVIALIKSLKK